MKRLPLHSMIFLIIVILLNRCTILTTKKVNNEDEYNYLINKSIIRYDLLRSYEDTSISCNQVTYPLVLNYVETSCSRCVLELKKWSDFFKKNKLIMSKVDFIVIAAGEPDFYFDYHYKSKKYYDFKVYKDPNFSFIDLNGISDIMVVKTLLINKEGKICFYGSPVLNSKLIPPFLQNIREQLNQ